MERSSFLSSAVKFALQSVGVDYVNAWRQERSYFPSESIPDLLVSDPSLGWSGFRFRFFEAQEVYAFAGVAGNDQIASI